MTQQIQSDGGMADREYVPKLNDSVTIDGVDGALVVVGVDAGEKLAKVSTHTTPGFLYILPWSKLSYLDESQNASRARSYRRQTKI